MKWIKTPHPTYILTKNENSYLHGYGTRFNSPPPYTPYVPPVHTYSYYKIAADGSYALVKGTTTGNPDEIKNQKIKDLYNKKKALQLAKIAGIIDTYLDYKKVPSEKSQAWAKEIEQKYLHSTAGGGKDPDWRDLLDEILNGKNKLGDDKYDEAGEAINYLMRDAGKNFRTAKELYKAGEIKRGAAYIVAGLIESHMAVMVMLKFPL